MPGGYKQYTLAVPEGNDTTASDGDISGGGI